MAAHCTLVAAGAALFAGSFEAREPDRARARLMPEAREQIVEIELPVLVNDGTGLLGAAPVEPLAAPHGGGEVMPRPDMAARGRGGTDASDLPALNLADRDDGTRLSPEVRSRIDRSQIQRVRSALARASRDDWRASREPMELTFLASGRATSRRPERRAPARVDPSAGAHEQGAPQRRGGQVGALEIPLGEGMSPRAIGGAVEGGARSSPGLGVRDRAPGHDSRASAEVPYARPMVSEGTPSVPASTRGRPNDTEDSEQEVATAIQSLVHASTAGGVAGRGPGGEEGSGPIGSGGMTGGGSSAKVLGNGHGAGVDSNPGDRRRTQYMRQVMGKIHPLWANAFPTWAVLEGRQGTAIITFVISADGSVTRATVTRPSGVPEFDENCRQAVLRGAPYAPLPPELGPSFRWAMPFEAKNPAVRPRK